MRVVDEKPPGSGLLPELPTGTIAHVVQPLSDEDRPARSARRCMKGWCRTLGVAENLAEDLDLAVSELVTNASVHGKGPVWLRLAVMDGGAIVALDVYDAAPITARLRKALDRPDRPAFTDEGGGVLEVRGRGLHLVLALASDVVVLPRVSDVGKTIRASFLLRTAVSGNEV